MRVKYILNVLEVSIKNRKSKVKHRGAIGMHNAKLLNPEHFSLIAEAALKCASKEGKDVAEPADLESPSVARKMSEFTAKSRVQSHANTETISSAMLR